MRNLKEILEETQRQASKDNCQSWNSIALSAMENAIKEYKDEMIEQLESISNNYEIIDGCYIINKTIIDHYIEKKDSEL